MVHVTVRKHARTHARSMVHLTVQTHRSMRMCMVRGLVGISSLLQRCARASNETLILCVGGRVLGRGRGGGDRERGLVR
jgi:hypothetical protein